MICIEVKKACLKISELKRKATEVQENMISHRERTRIIANEHAIAEALVNNSMGNVECLVRAHTLTCGVPDRESSEIKCLREATDVIDAWQQHHP